MNEYWEERYRAEGKIWGDTPSRTAEYALEIFRKNKVKKLLVPGSGYGRNTRLFSAAGFDVTGVELSPEACRLAREFDPKTKVFNASALDMSFLKEQFDSVYCFNVLHVFSAKDRKTFLRECKEKVRRGGLMFFTVFSEKDPGYGKGKETEPNTFESRPGRAAHYFSESDLKEHFTGTEILETGVLEDPEDHGEGPHTHFLRYICVRVK